MTLIVTHISIIIITFASSSTYSKTTSKSTHNHSNKHTLSINNARLYFPHWTPRNRSVIDYHSEFIECVDSAKIFEHVHRECTKHHWACEKYSQTVIDRHKNNRDVNMHEWRCYTMKIITDALCTKLKVDIDLVQFKDDNYSSSLDDEMPKLVLMKK